MTNWITLRLWMAALLALITAFFIHGANKKPFIQFENVSPRYQSFPYVLWLPGYLLFFYIWESMNNGADTETTYRHMFTFCFMLFLHMTVYYAAVMLLLPYLRKQFSAYACAQLWVLPCVLYIFIYRPFMDYLWNVEQQLLVIPLSEALASVLCKIWFLGFFAVLLWKTVVHLRFREHIEESCREVTDLEVLQIWEEEQKKLGEYPLLEKGPLISPVVRTPLSIGVFKSTTSLILPEREYSADELRLIFQHEIIHIQRRDGTSKFFLAFCTAMCWFNPLMWKAMRRCADDLELSCDEAVLEEAGASTRHMYARLILQTAGDERGFTTCLSATASSLRYRLQNIITPYTRKSGTFLVALLAFCLIMSFGYVTISYI